MQTRKISLMDGDVVVLSVPTVLTGQQREHLQSHARELFPNNQAIIAEGGISIDLLMQSDRLKAIETKLDALIDALAEEEPQQFDLEGNALPEAQEGDPL